MRINVRVIPRAKINRVEVQPDGIVRVHTTTAPTDGKATNDVIKMLAEYYHVSIDYLVGLTDEPAAYPRKRK